MQLRFVKDVANQAGVGLNVTGKADSAKDENYQVSSTISKHTQMLNVSYKTRYAAEAVYNLSDDQDLLSQAKNWAKMSNEWFSHFSNGAVYAGLLFKTGEKQKAIEVMEVASRDPFLSSVPDVQKLLKDNIELIRKIKPLNHFGKFRDEAV